MRRDVSVQVPVGGHAVVVKMPTGPKVAVVGLPAKTAVVRLNGDVVRIQPLPAPERLSP
jgi:serine acetyltransferase